MQGCRQRDRHGLRATRRGDDAGHPEGAQAGQQHTGAGGSKPHLGAATQRRGAGRRLWLGAIDRCSAGGIRPFARGSRRGRGRLPFIDTGQAVGHHRAADPQRRLAPPHGLRAGD